MKPVGPGGDMDAGSTLESDAMKKALASMKFVDVHADGASICSNVLALHALLS